MRFLLGLLLACSPLFSAAGELTVYAIDVEGGKATLFVSPSGQSMLVDAGYDGFNNRDADRILAAARDAGVMAIDYLVISHYHKDHFGGVPQLAARIPIRNFMDHGKNVEALKDSGKWDRAYKAVWKKGNRVVLKAGDTIPISGFNVEVVTAAGKGISRPLMGAGQRNPACSSYRALDYDPGENARSVGMIVSYGKFRLVDLGDLYWNQEYDLVCPNNNLGVVDVYMTTHHAKKTSGSPQMVWALHPKVAIMNNGPDSGGAPSAWQTIHDSPGFVDLWQLHFATANPKEQNAPEAFIANAPGNGQDGNWIRLTAHQDGSFTVRNGRTGFEKSYQ